MRINRKIHIPSTLNLILDNLEKSGAKPFFVGGCVRDFLLKKPIKDFDIEVFGIENLEELKNILEKYAKVHDIGKSFGVLKLNIDDFEFDFSIPRLEKKTGDTHKSFEIKLDSNLDIKQAAKRRDFTINALYFDYSTKTITDPFGGINDLKNRKIKHIDNKTFIEDSLRVFRAIQFASRFDFKIAKKSKKLLKTIIKSGELDNLSKERVFEELKKLLLKSKKPSVGLKLLDEFKILPISFFGKYKAIDNLSKIVEKYNIEEKRALILFFTILVKELKEDDVFLFLSKLSDDKKFISKIVALSSQKAEKDEVKLKKQSFKVVLEDLILVEMAFKNKKIEDILNLCKELDILDKALKPHIMGVDLLNLGFTPSCDFRNMLDFALNLQITQNLSKEELKQNLKKSF